MRSLRSKAEFCKILLSELKEFSDEIDIAALISNIDWPMGYAILFNCTEETLCKLISCKDWIYDLRADHGYNARPIIRTKFWWEESGQFFYFILPKGINLEQYQKSLPFETEKKEIKN